MQEPTEVKEQVNRGQFQNQPQNINRDGAPDKQFQVREVLIRKVQEKKAKQQRIENMAEAIISKAEQGDVPVFNSIVDRIDGKPPQGIGGYGADGSFIPQNLVVQYGGDDSTPTPEA